jgi:hypothetical protein
MLGEQIQTAAGLDMVIVDAVRLISKTLTSKNLEAIYVVTFGVNVLY